MKRILSSTPRSRLGRAALGACLLVALAGLLVLGCEEPTRPAVPAESAAGPNAVHAAAATFELASISVGFGHTCGITRNDAVYCWGANHRGQLGIGTTTNQSTPVAVVGGHFFRQVSTGFHHTCGVTTQGLAFCWGENEHGQLGDGTTTDRLTPVAVVDGHLFSQVSTGPFHTCGVTTQDVAYCWGRGLFGVLGNGTTDDHWTPTEVADGHAFRQVDGGSGHTCAILRTNDAAYCWGTNESGDIGDGTTTWRLTPVAVADGHAFRDVSAGGGHTCGVTTTGVAYCWGGNSYGQLGDGTTINRLTPTEVGSAFREVSAGHTHTCGVTTNDLTYCWGDNTTGNLGDGTNTDRTAPTTVAGGHTFRAVAANGHTCALTTTDVAWCWGNNFAGQLGDGTTFFRRLIPVQVISPPGAIIGTVTSMQTGASLAGVRVTVDGETRTTDAVGFYAIDKVEAGDKTVTVSNLPAACLNPGPLPATVMGGATTTLNISLDCPLGAIKGTVTSRQTGALLAGVKVTVDGKTETTNDVGFYSIGKLMAGDKNVTLSNLPPTCTNPGPVQAKVTVGTTTTRDISLDCPLPGAIRGTVTSQNGALPGVTVIVDGINATTDAVGFYSIGKLMAGLKTVTLSDLPAICTNPGPLGTTVMPGATTTFDIMVNCAPRLVIEPGPFVFNKPPAWLKRDSTTPGGKAVTWNSSVITVKGPTGTMEPHFTPFDWASSYMVFGEHILILDEQKSLGSKRVTLVNFGLTPPQETLVLFEPSTPALSLPTVQWSKGSGDAFFIYAAIGVQQASGLVIHRSDNGKELCGDVPPSPVDLGKLTAAATETQLMILYKGVALRTCNKPAH